MNSTRATISASEKEVAVIGRNTYFRAALALSIALAVAVASVRIIMFAGEGDGLFSSSPARTALYAVTILSTLAIIGLSGAARHMIGREFNSLMVEESDGTLREPIGEIAIALRRVGIVEISDLYGIATRGVGAMLSVLFLIYPIVHLGAQAHAGRVIGRFSGWPNFVSCLLAVFGAALFAFELVWPFIEKRRSVQRRQTEFAIVSAVGVLCVAGFFVAQMVALNLNIVEPMLHSPARYFTIFSCCMQILFFVQEAKVRIGGGRTVFVTIWTLSAMGVVLFGVSDALPSLIGGISGGGASALFNVIELICALYAGLRILGAKPECSIINEEDKRSGKELQEQTND